MFRDQFPSLHIKSLEDFCYDFKLMDFPTGNKLYRQGDICDKIYLMKSGEVEVRTHQNPNRISPCQLAWDHVTYHEVATLEKLMKKKRKSK